MEADHPLPIDGPAAVRSRPGLFFGGTSARAIELMAEDLLSNAIDQFLSGHATRVSLTCGPRALSVGDDGEGFPLEDPARVERAMGLHRSPSAFGRAPHVDVDAMRMAGVAAVMAFSERLSVRAWREGRLWEMVFGRGVEVQRACALAEGEGRGTTITLEPDPLIFGDARARRSILRARSFHLAHLFPGLHVTMDAEHFHAPGGLGELVAVEAAWADVGDSEVPFQVTCRTGDAAIAAAAIGHSSRTAWRSWVDGRETREHGVHVRGFKRALALAGWQPAVALIHAVVLQPQYDGATKDRLMGPDIAPVVEALLRAPLEEHVGGQPRSHG